jgi:hypothetical protein
MESIICVSQSISGGDSRESQIPAYAVLDFSNILSKSAIERLADVDEYEVVREVQVCLAVFINVAGPHPFLRNTSQIMHLSCPRCSRSTTLQEPQSHCMDQHQILGIQMLWDGVYKASLRSCSV